MSPFGFTEVVHPPDILVDNFTGDLQLVGKSAECLFVPRNVRPEYF